jgi:tRNA (guanine26-N2/guanine27-N2)-dimethyltransferase
MSKSSLPPGARVLEGSAMVEIPEGAAKILFATTRDVFYNKAQVVNRDVSVLALRAWAQGRAAGLPAPTVFEGLAASGLRSLRYALEVPELGQITANDLDPTAVEAIARNRAHCGVAEGKVVPSTGDCALELLRRRGSPLPRPSVVDLDPFGSAMPFLDSAVQAVEDGGLLAVTCTDLLILCGAQMSVCGGKYGSFPVKAPYHHEQGLRIVLASIARAAAQHRRVIEPVLSLFLDFYVRVFVVVRSDTLAAGRVGTSLASVYQCQGCPSYALQPLQRAPAEGSQMARLAVGPPVGRECASCGSPHHVGGPLWSGQLHSAEFVSRVEALARDSQLATKDRLAGVLALARSEVPTPLFTTVSDWANTVRCTVPPYDAVRSALLALGYRCSLSHCVPNSLKTDAPPEALADVIREWVKKNPISAARAQEKTPGNELLARPMTREIDLTITSTIPRENKRFRANPEGLRGGPGSLPNKKVA